MSIYAVSRVMDWGRTVAVACAMSAVTPAFAELRQTTAPVLGGATASAVTDTRTGLEWLTPRATTNMTVAAVRSSGLLDLGYRYATSGELLDLLGSASVDAERLRPNIRWPYSAFTAPEVAGLDNLVGLLGPTALGGFPLGSPYRERYVIAVLADIDPNWPQQGQQMATIGIGANGGGYAFILGPGFLGSGYEVGSFLVRQASAVPEPSAFLLFTAGAACLLLHRRRRERAVGTPG